MGRGAATPLETFAGEAAWRWRVQLQVERVISPVRAAVVVLNVVVWATRPNPPGSLPALAWTLVAGACGYVILDLLMLYRWADRAARFPQGSGLLDFAFTLAWLGTTGLQNSPFLPLLFLGAVSAPLRLPLGLSLAASVGYTATYALLAPPPGRFAAAYVVLASLVLCAWTAVTRNDQRVSLRDPLTGSFGRRPAEFRIEQLLQTRAFPFALALIDLDNFKEVNDTYGHVAGDTVLAEASRLLAAQLRPEDVLARYGGDEFLLILPGTSAAAAAQTAQRLQTSFAETLFRLREPQAALRLTLSIGVAEAGSGCTLAHLVQAADAALYRAKQFRNRVESASGTAC